MADDSYQVIRVAVATRDGRTIQSHFGQAERFLIYEIDGPDIRLVDIRESNHSRDFESHRHFGSCLAENIALASDCRFVLAAQIGPGAQSQLTDGGVMPLQVSGPVESVLRVLSHKIRQVLPEHRIETRSTARCR